MTRQVPRKTRGSVKSAANDLCWLCGCKGVEVAHVIAKKNDDLFDLYHRMGLLRTTDINSSDNLLFLCPGCHNRFDKNPPEWILLPTNLKDLLEAEERFQKGCISADENNTRLLRNPPEQGEGYTFARYQVREGPTQEVIAQTPANKWGGSPIAAIIHSAEAMYKHVRLDPTEKQGIPEEVAFMLQRLLFLYGKPAPKFTGRIQISVEIPVAQKFKPIEAPKVTETAETTEAPKVTGTLPVFKMPERTKTLRTPKTSRTPQAKKEQNSTPSTLKRQRDQTPDNGTERGDDSSVCTGTTARSHDTKNSSHKLWMKRQRHSGSTTERAKRNQTRTKVEQWNGDIRGYLSALPEDI